MMEKRVGKVTDYFAKIGVIALEVEEPIRVGDRIHIKGHTTDFLQTVESMQLEHQPIEEAKAGQTVGMKVQERARKGDIVYKVEEEDEGKEV
jgi:putative protease